MVSRRFQVWLDTIRNPTCLASCAIAAVAFLAPSARGLSYAADIVATKPGTISVVGPIVKGDADKLRRIIREQRFGVGAIILDGPGGEVDEAIQMADIIRPLLPIVAVAPGRFCASACFFVWLAGNPRNAQSREYMQRVARQKNSQTGGAVGLHRPYRANIDGVVNDQHQLMRRIQEYLEKQMVSRRLIDLMMSRPSNDVYWLTSTDFDELGEYSPQIEELLIRKCEYVRVTTRSADAGLDPNRMLRSITCANDVLGDARAKAWKEVKR